MRYQYRLCRDPGLFGSVKGPYFWYYLIFFTFKVLTSYPSVPDSLKMAKIKAKIWCHLRRISHVTLSNMFLLMGPVKLNIKSYEGRVMVC